MCRRAGYLLWAAAGLALAGLLALEAYEVVAMGSLSCELSPGSSVYGEASWTWAAPGRTCTYALPGGLSHVDDPPPARLMVLALLIAWPLIDWPPRSRYRH